MHFRAYLHICRYSHFNAQKQETFRQNFGRDIRYVVPNQIIGEACPPSPRPVSAPGAVSSSSDYDRAVRAMIDRFGAAEECAGAVAFLSSDDASFVTGETIVISGGAPSRL